jgi:quinoprotein glucose dehydrogenase
LKLPPLGNPGRAAPVVTKTLLFIGERSPIMAAAGSRLPPDMPRTIAPGYGGNGFKALDKATGATVWRIELPAGTTGAPISYMFQGKQYIVVAVGDEDRPAEWVALALP